MVVAVVDVVDAMGVVDALDVMDEVDVLDVVDEVDVLDVDEEVEGFDVEDDVEDLDVGDVVDALDVDVVDVVDERDELCELDELDEIEVVDVFDVFDFVDVLDVVEVVDAVNEVEVVLGLVLLVPKLYMFNLFGPPHISAAFPLQGMLQPTLPSEAGPPPLFTLLSHQHSCEYSRPASTNPAAWHAATHNSTVIAEAPPVTVSPFCRVRPPLTLSV